ncbi:class A beta-lactamase [Chitinophaga nivalis]|uniref:Beta-lactamase n=1 Tax=Chitinophaga nivalis TaxID=2991709 RepID=A0ABT3IPI8_9BACT|nr:class A beta-lactamase [Chitinophaga nivalis]MCW3464442.1 class A beta-lactamase [Chitinophaga nivalis]MCW3485867.1 class A beta-lactamase [Chitinophaga nivalis]
MFRMNQYGCDFRLTGLLLFLGFPVIVSGQQTLMDKLKKIADGASGKIGIYAAMPETGKHISLNGDTAFPMQSVYKFPIAMAILDQVDKGKLTLDQPIMIYKSDMIPAGGISPVRDKYPEGKVALPLRELLWYNVGESDGSACDVLLRLLGGTAAAHAYVQGLGRREIVIATTEQVQVANDTIQYQNRSTPAAMTALLLQVQEGRVLSQASREFLLHLMITSGPGKKRLKGELPVGTVVAHKTGTAGTINGLTRATNDVGIITLPGGKHIAISVFIKDSRDSQEKREAVIAAVAKAVWDAWVD